ncbi:MAG: hypothetical protein JWM11_3909, partial [Planctomycetaceae bacterium]|nr:hypothetical protein [Planctomycetaceae bacterium]
MPIQTICKWFFSIQLPTKTRFEGISGLSITAACKRKKKILHVLGACFALFLTATGWSDEPKSAEALVKELREKPDFPEKLVQQLADAPVTPDLMGWLAAVAVNDSSSLNQRNVARSVLYRYLTKNPDLLAPRKLLRGLQSTPEIRRETAHMLGEFRAFEVDCILELTERIKTDNLLFVALSRTFADPKRMLKLVKSDPHEDSSY